MKPTNSSKPETVSDLSTVDTWRTHQIKPTPAEQLAEVRGRAAELSRGLDAALALLRGHCEMLLAEVPRNGPGRTAAERLSGVSPWLEDIARRLAALGREPSGATGASGGTSKSRAQVEPEI
jgi:hypothetical protein